jgi:hypothetical protein
MRRGMHGWSGAFDARVLSGMLDGWAVPKRRVNGSGSLADEAVLMPPRLRTRFLKKSVE